MLIVRLIFHGTVRLLQKNIFLEHAKESNCSSRTDKKKNHKFYPKPDGSKVLNQEKVKI